MNFITIFLIAIGLASDAFVVAITKGMVIKSTVKHALIIALVFGGFESIMILLGWILGTSLESFVSTWAPWIAFILLSAVGIKMVYDSFLDKEDNDIFSLKEIFLLAFAVTIDAFVIGISFALLNFNINTFYNNRFHNVHIIIYWCLSWKKIRTSIWTRNRNIRRSSLNWNGNIHFNQLKKIMDINIFFFH